MDRHVIPNCDAWDEGGYPRELHRQARDMAWRVMMKQRITRLPRRSFTPRASAAPSSRPSSAARRPKGAPATQAAAFVSLLWLLQMTPALSLLCHSYDAFHELILWDEARPFHAPCRAIARL